MARIDRTIRMQACLVVTSRDTLEAALKAETDPEVRELIAFRLESLK